MKALIFTGLIILATLSTSCILDSYRQDEPPIPEAIRSQCAEPSTEAKFTKAYESSQKGTLNYTMWSLLKAKRIELKPLESQWKLLQISKVANSPVFLGTKIKLSILDDRHQTLLDHYFEFGNFIYARSSEDNNIYIAFRTDQLPKNAKNIQLIVVIPQKMWFTSDIVPLSDQPEAK